MVYTFEVPGITGRPHLGHGVIAVAGVLALSACGLPSPGSAQRIDDGDVPYRLLETDVQSAEPSTQEGIPGPVPVVFWVIGDRLVPEAADGSCAESPEALVARLLSELTGGPGDNSRDLGRSTALPPGSGLELIDIVDGRAEVDVESDMSVSAERLPVAAGQLVLTVLSAPGVRSVSLVSEDGPVQVPLPGGALTEGSVTVDDYTGLVLDRYSALGKWGCFAVSAADTSEVRSRSSPEADHSRATTSSTPTRSSVSRLRRDGRFSSIAMPCAAQRRRTHSSAEIVVEEAAGTPGMSTTRVRGRRPKARSSCPSRSSRAGPNPRFRNRTTTRSTGCAEVSS